MGGRPRILFIGFAQSSHTHAWISLLDASRFDVRLHGVHGTKAPVGFPVVMARAPSQFGSLRHRIARRFLGTRVLDPEMDLLAEEIDEWRPHVIHTLGLEPASYLLLETRRRLGVAAGSTWVVTARGGPELALHRLIPREAARIAEVLKECDQLIADNELNYEYAVKLGMDPRKAASFGRMPGVGGVDVAALRALRTVPATASRVIVMPKAYECPASKVLPVFEALKLCWEEIQPCEVHFTAATPEAEMWFATLPERIRAGCRMHERISREDLLRLMGRSRLMLAPSLTDGVPNVLYEAMATQCAPIVSPIDTLRPLVADGVNVLFARNLYPEEIARALVRGMSDDRLVESLVAANARLVEKTADRAQIRGQVSDYYRHLAQCKD
jgi:glycosyltransferase involved in cell wall biosynthesis